MTTHRVLRLEDGRQLESWVSGPDSGRVLVFHHGTPSSGLQFRYLARACLAHGLRLITTSRPGYGDSSRLEGRTIADVVKDTRAVLDAYEAERCVVAGWSGGGPHALACAALLSDRVDAALIIAGVAPYEADGLDWLVGMGQDNLDEFGACLEGEAALRPYLEAQRDDLMAAKVEDVVRSLESLLPEVDRAVMSDEFGEDLVASMQDGMRTGIDGWLDDDIAFVRPWGFDLSGVTVPTMLWQGSEDLMVPFAHGRWLATKLPGARAHLERGEGHLSIALGGIDRMLDELAAVD